jgi:hypothetical protein
LVSGVRSAIHVRTGPRTSAAAIDTWLTQHQVEIIPFDEVYTACVHVLQHYERIPDLVFVGRDWLAGDELNIVSYVRQTWPRSGIIVYGDTGETPLCDLLPLVLTCRGPAAVHDLLAATPAELVRRLGEQLRPLVLGPAPTEDVRRPRAVVRQSLPPLAQNSHPT